MIFVDSNIPMYLVGAPHPLKDAARGLLEACIRRGERLVTYAVVLQEILHRYSVIRRLDAIQPAFDVVFRVVDEVFPILVTDIERAKTVLLGLGGLSTRDAVHVAVMERHNVDVVMSFDTSYERVPGLKRLPADS